MSALAGHVSSHLVRRATEDLPSTIPEEEWKRIIREVPAWGALTLFLSIIVFGVGIVLIVYTLEVVFRLACVETPQKDFLIQNVQRPGGNIKPFRDSESPDDDDEAEDPEVLLVHQRPITSKIRTTIQHLVSIGGATARWRGISMALMYTLCTALLSGVLGWLTPFVSTVLARIILSRWEMAWTHIVITNPSSDPWYRRILPFSAFKKIWAPTALAAIAQQVAMVIPAVFFFVFQLHDDEKMRQGYSGLDVLKGLMLVLVGVAAYFGIAVPAEVALARVQASMLPADQEAIVPFDRTFDGRVASEAEGGKGKLGFIEAWKSFDNEARTRVVKLILKMFMITLALYFLFALTLMLEMYTIILPAFRRARHDAPSDDMKLM